MCFLPVSFVLEQTGKKLGFMILVRDSAGDDDQRKVESVRSIVKKSMPDSSIVLRFEKRQWANSTSGLWVTRSTSSVACLTK